MIKQPESLTDVKLAQLGRSPDPVKLGRAINLLERPHYDLDLDERAEN